VVGRAIENAARGHAVDVNLSMGSADEELLDLIRDGARGERRSCK
jgi:hypothetical protein